ncbi:MAG: HTH domain-containing protein, partial [Clostridium sp.]
MGKTYFTEEQQSNLRKNPYVQKVSAKSITYTKEFKEKFEE